MPTAITHDIQVTVETAYQQTGADDFDGHHMFAYRITIRNKGEYTIKLLRRHWYITDANVGKQEVEGEGVVGQQPVIEPGSLHRYVSGCSLQSDFGTMHGTYLVERESDGVQFEVEIPMFRLIVPYRMN